MPQSIEEFEFLPTTCISDAMNGMNHLDPLIKSLKEEYQICGRAFTVQVPMNDNLLVLQAIKEARSGDILVIDAKGDRHFAVAGDFILGMAQTLGVGGIVVDGVIRDIVDVKKLDFPVFCKGTTVAASQKYGRGSLNEPISCGGKTVQPGDLIIGDADGVVVVPKNIEKEVYKKALDKLKKDETRENRVSGNPEEIINYINGMLSKEK
ncbi:RraA family protein [Scopulibacillus cellulosilyticus]|uniref:Putative 4-hydroxy-4-methyl-2-oxoglutarate aldolase n=1 Tax=Scopulibacillus cellulosilyticus TaxID=2665665 RepID=A0ABW2Q0S7_9BACL